MDGGAAYGGTTAISLGQKPGAPVAADIAESPKPVAGADHEDLLPGNLGRDVIAPLSQPRGRPEQLPRGREDVADIPCMDFGGCVMNRVEVTHGLVPLLTVIRTLRPRRVKGQARRAAKAQITASAKEISMFQLAIDRLNNSHGTSSQRTRGAFMI